MFQERYLRALFINCQNDKFLSIQMSSDGILPIIFVLSYNNVKSFVHALAKLSYCCLFQFAILRGTKSYFIRSLVGGTCA